MGARKRKSLVGVFLCIIFGTAMALSFLPVAAQGAIADPHLLPKPVNGRINDAAGLLSPDAEAAIAHEINRVEESTSVEIGVATLPTAQPLTPKDYATRLFREWGVGKKDKDNGILILVAVEERRVEIETGYGVEGILPDGRIGRILDSAVVPRLKTGDFGGAVLAGVQAIEGVVTAEYVAEPRSADRRSNDLMAAVGSGAVTFILVMILLWLLMIRFGGKRKCPQCGAPLHIHREVLEHATALREGKERVTTECSKCGFHKVAVVVIPILIAEVIRRGRHGPGGFGGGGFGGFGGGGFGGGSGGGFGGGSSGGGGAGRGW